MHAETFTASGETPAIQQRPVILVVEDEELVRVSAAEYLRFSHFDVIEAATADEAVTLLSAGANVDLVFSDIRMPGRLDGYGLAQWLAAHRPALPVLLTSGFAGAAREPAIRRPVLPKPYSFDLMLHRISTLLSDGSLTERA